MQGKTFPLVVLANRLPITHSRDDSGNQVTVLSPGGLVAAVAPALDGKNAAWVGWSGNNGFAAEPVQVDGITAFPVAVEPDLARQHYEGYSNSTVWPLFHQVGISVEESSDWFEAHQEVNKRFADKVAELVSPGGLVWVHDYQVMLTPRLIRDIRPDVRIGYFHHIPFPSTKILLDFRNSEAIVRGLAGADILGFQRENDSNNFRDALKIWADPDSGSAPVVKTYPISIDFPAVAASLESSVVGEKSRAFTSQWGSARKVFLGVDRLDYTKGILERLEAFEALLDDGLIKVEDVIFVQVGSPSRENVESYQEFGARVANVVERINHKHSTPQAQAVHFIASNLERDEMLALFVAADVMVVSSLRDGMNLVAKEFVACKADESGVLVLSIYTGAADQMTEAILVDPTNPKELRDALYQAFHMSPQEATTRMHQLREQVRTHDVARWSAEILADLGSITRS
jgi:alpha,alpha-trehalose-phosphate synthase [UDP-forming]